jgi:hypothetical protein
MPAILLSTFDAETAMVTSEQPHCNSHGRILQMKKFHTFDERVRSISLGPTPITEANLYAKASMYLPFLYTVLTYIDNQVHILEPVPQDFARTGYVRRELHEVSYLIVET